VPIVKPTTAYADKEAIHWSLSWKPDGRCDSFTREAILACAPPTSGVYGLFNFDCQIFIGESANIQEVLLRLESESDFQSHHLRPTGFTFEPCPGESRKLKAAELIARFRPVLQAEAGLSETGSPSNGPTATETRQAGRKSETRADDHEFPLYGEKRPKVHRRFQFKRAQLVASAAALIASAVVTLYLVELADNTQKQINAAGEKTPARISITQSAASGEVGIGSKPRNVSSINAAGRIANRNTAPTPATPDIHAYASNRNGAVQFAATKASAADETGVHTLLGPVKTIPTADSSGSANLGKKWSVQISAAPAKDTADHLVQQLIAKGYDGYVVRAEVKGQIYYRVRVGHFAAREEAESMRQSLARQGGYRDAYLTGD
jgi:cell division septation protein DedD